MPASARFAVSRMVRTDGRLSCGSIGGTSMRRAAAKVHRARNYVTATREHGRFVERFFSDSIWLADRDAQTEPFPLEQPQDSPSLVLSAHSSMLPWNLRWTISPRMNILRCVHSTFGWSPTDAAKVLVRADVFPDRTEVHYEGPAARVLVWPAGRSSKGRCIPQPLDDDVRTGEDCFIVRMAGQTDWCGSPHSDARGRISVARESGQHECADVCVCPINTPSIQASFARSRSMAVRVAKNGIAA